MIRTSPMRYWFIGAALLGSAGLAVAMMPTKRLADTRGQTQLAAMIPVRLGDWVQDRSLAPVSVSPDVEARLKRIYGDTLSRTYINSKKQRVMLSVAYGGEQSRDLQVHRPDICYVAQGFQVGNSAKDAVSTGYGRIPVMHLTARQAGRVEPITYWITVGQTVVRGGFEQKLAKIRYGLTGTVPDGVLVRVSSISEDEQASFRLHEEFISALAAALSAQSRLQLLGSPSG